MENYHILNGDCLADNVKEILLNEKLIVFRECLIEGNLQGNNLEELMTNREIFLRENYDSTKNYHQFSGIESMQKIPDYAKIYLWFEDDLFCQANMWFLIDWLSQNNTFRFYRVFPIIKSSDERWKGFGNSNAKDLKTSLQNAVPFSEEDLEIGRKLWTAYQNDNFEELIETSKTPSLCFRNLEEVCKAHIERFPPNNDLGRPQKCILEIMENQPDIPFSVLFQRFSEIEEIYGFGDLQVKRMIDLS